MTAGSKSLFIFLMGLAWRCRISMPLLLSGTVAVMGRAWMFQIRVHTVRRVEEDELVFYNDDIPEEEDGPDDENNDDDDDVDDDDSSWDSSTADSWETIVEEVAYG